MSKHRTVFPHEAADRLSIRELVEAYAHCADFQRVQTRWRWLTVDRSTTDRVLGGHASLDGEVSTAHER
jgi:hypothetical protein